MNETIVTVVGHVAKEPAMRTTVAGVRVTSFRLASTERRFDRDIKDWRDGDTIFYTVTCWRTAAENVYSSVQKGQPVVVHGRLKDSSYDKEGQRRTVIEIAAYAVGHDLTRGVGSFTKAGPAANAEPNVAAEFDEEETVDTATGEILDGPAGDGFPAEGASVESSAAPRSAA